jgi:hypothetical protein
LDDIKVSVLMVHGLARTPLSLLWLAGAIRRSGYPTAQFGYVACAEPYDRILERLRSRCSALAAEGPYAIVAHSLGGLLVRAALAEPDVPPPEHVVMLGTPNQRSRTAEWAVRFAPWRWIAGEAGRKLADRSFYAGLPGLSVPYTIIAGTRGLRLSSLPLGGRANDGLVAVEETGVEPDDEVIEILATHTFIMNRRRVLRAVLRALKSVD